MTCTTGFRRFVECQKHLAEAILHSAKALPSAALGKAHMVKKMTAKKSLLGVFFWALDKFFCRVQKSTQQNKVKGSAKLLVTLVLLSAGRKALCKISILCRVPCTWHSAKYDDFTECHCICTQQSPLSLLSAKAKALDKVVSQEPGKASSTECKGKCTWQSDLFFFFLLFSRVYEPHSFKHQT